MSAFRELECAVDLKDSDRGIGRMSGKQAPIKQHQSRAQASRRAGLWRGVGRWIKANVVRDIRTNARGATVH